MNGKTAKLLRQWSTEMGGTPRRVAKDLWKNTPRNKQGELRTNILNQLKDIEESKTITMPDGTAVVNTK